MGAPSGGDGIPEAACSPDAAELATARPAGADAESARIDPAGMGAGTATVAGASLPVPAALAESATPGADVGTATMGTVAGNVAGCGIA